MHFITYCDMWVCRTKKKNKTKLAKNNDRKVANVENITFDWGNYINRKNGLECCKKRAQLKNARMKKRDKKSKYNLKQSKTDAWNLKKFTKPVKLKVT